MLRLAFIILAKRKGPNWTQKNIIKDMIQPLIEKAGVRDGVREFSVSILGPLMKPYPNDMKVHCEVVVNQLLEMVDNGKILFSNVCYVISSICCQNQINLCIVIKLVTKKINFSNTQLVLLKFIFEFELLPSIQ